ncbi:endo-1,4-beta-xylanase [candidate division KSB1 bacterium]|nr:endo-1,4-beta-xylanase [candidate division KSB1 bacterium]
MSNTSRRLFLKHSTKTLAAFSLGLGCSEWLQAQSQQKKVIKGEEWREMDPGASGYRLTPADNAILNKAKANIFQIRMRDMELQLVDRNDNPLKEFPVEIVQIRQAFPFGDQLWQLDRFHRFNEHHTDKAFYWRLRFKELLNAANALCYWTERPRNDGPKTEDIQGRPELEGFTYCVDWANSQGLYVKGHPLFWSIPKCVPDWVKRYDYETQIKFAEVRVRNLVAQFKGRIKMWDAVNEPLWEAAFKNLPQREWPHIEPIENMVEYIIPVLRWAREEDPDVTYLINDYGLCLDPPSGPRIAKDGTEISAKYQRKRFLKLMAALSDRGVPPNAMGIQSHVGGWMHPTEQFDLYDEMSAANLPIHITEFWANTKELEETGKYSPSEIENMQAEFIENFVTCAFGHPSIEAFFFWGLMEAVVKWGEYSSHELKPLYFRLQTLFNKKWMTNVQLTTNGDGKIKFRGFHGDYSLRYSLMDNMKTGIPFSVNKYEKLPLKIIAGLAGAK